MYRQVGEVNLQELYQPLTPQAIATTSQSHPDEIQEVCCSRLALYREEEAKKVLEGMGIGCNMRVANKYTSFWGTKRV